jgi:hypothetical protein
VASVSVAATATAQDQTRGRARIGDGAAIDCRYTPHFSFTFQFNHFLTSTVFSVVVHPAFTRFPTCSCHTLTSEVIPLYKLPPSPLCDTRFLFPSPLRLHLLHAYSSKILVYPLIRRFTYIGLSSLSLRPFNFLRYTRRLGIGKLTYDTYERTHMMHMSIYLFVLRLSMWIIGLGIYGMGEHQKPKNGSA